MFLIFCFVCFMKHFLKYVITLLLRIVNLRSKGKTASRLINRTYRVSKLFTGKNRFNCEAM